MKRTTALVLAALATMFAAGCTSPGDGGGPAASTAGTSAAAPADGSFLAAHGLSGLDARGIIDRLDRAPVADRPQTLRASVRPSRLQLTDTRTGATTALDIPAGLFYLSVAPYVGHTHECFFHSLTTCQGELTGQDLQVRITDTATGKVLVDGAAKTSENGFTGFWLPSGITATLQITHNGRTATTDIATTADAPTCLTTLRLT
ncbi:CueP family metal-binding protein [Dactylosporangium sp. NPDC051485]|uniref:CueP family metal-binding protein n=1 Tax=Dactylosporangium sp. NPDC051485 TaxID=3154846 RepID=UPI00344665B8